MARALGSSWQNPFPSVPLPRASSCRASRQSRGSERERGRCSLLPKAPDHHPRIAAVGLPPSCLSWVSKPPLGFQGPAFWEISPGTFCQGPGCGARGRQGKGTFKTQPSLMSPGDFKWLPLQLGRGWGRGSDWHQMAEQGSAMTLPPQRISSTYF